MDDNIIGEVSFKFNSRFSQLIGRNLISNPIVAVSELVKNAYDADANNINVEFKNILSDTSILTITDDGEGMSFNDIATKWMMVGTDNKVHTPFTTKGRRKLGEKGIGRFSVERLAKKMILTSTKKGDDFSISFLIDWDTYETYNGEFSELKHKVIKNPCDVNLQGTTIVLEELRDFWGKDELLDLQKELEMLRPLDINKVSYKKYKFSGNEVKIKLSATEVLKNKKLIDSNFITYAQAHLYGEIREDMTSIIKVFIKSNISASKTDIREEYSYSKDSKEVDVSCGPLTYEIFVFLKDKRLYRSLNIVRKDMDEYLETFCGVKIYRDGFRILPFGDVDNDWLELNAQRTSSPEFRIATQNTIGIVYITRDKNPGLQDVLSRENMYETPEFSSLKKFVNLGFDKYTALQLRERKKKERKIKEEGQLALDYAKKAVTNFSSQVGTLKKAVSDTKVAKTPEQKNAHIAEVEKSVFKIVVTAEESIEKLKYAYNFYKKQTDFRSREMQIYRNIATLGISAAMFGHEALNQTVDSKAIINEIFSEHKDLIATVDTLNQQLIDLREDLILIDEKADFYRNYLRKEKQDRFRYIKLNVILTGLIKQHENAFKAIGVFPEISLVGDEKDFYIWGYEGDINTIFTNLITNGYKALKKEKGSKYLKFILEYKEGLITIHIINNGKVIAKEYRSKIFEPMFSTYSDGTGLGLTIVQDTLCIYQGTIVLAEDFPETHFIINIPRHEEPKEE